MGKVKLKIRMPLIFKENPTWYDVGDEFEVVDEKFMPMVGKCYKLKYAGCVFDGFYNSNNFEETDN